ncbi:MAG TPA: hypothetical protein VNU64_08330 [Burkholderiales bacterium]|nr:hypothetical protein [Burkholderiales bacterium]
MAFPRRHEKHAQAVADFRSMSDRDFARLSTEDKARHIHLGMQALGRTLAELDNAIPRVRSHGD